VSSGRGHDQIVLMYGTMGVRTDYANVYLDDVGPAGLPPRAPTNLRVQ
jgi:hypothetical protein